MLTVVGPGEDEYSGASTLYADPAMQALTVERWEERSRRHADREVVAACSLLAEPISAPGTSPRDEMYHQPVKAIRARGDDRLLVIHDGFPGLPTLPEPAAMGWEGVVFAPLLEWGASSLAGHAAFMVDTFEAHGGPRTVGTYPLDDDPIDAALCGTSTEWRLRGRLAGDVDRPDVDRDDEAAGSRGSVQFPCTAAS